ncbi:hypothetical protein [Escherichia coli]|uniref:hypothetical protein n=1 Tax=Escherichia coli TaxID=562 RepID=UPI0020187DFD|nr:hypothetical protein [Escherichia coli]
MQLKLVCLKKVPEGAEVFEGFETGWDNSVFFLSSGRIHVNMRYKMAFRAKKKNGDMAKNLTHLECSVAMAYCPFCGEKENAL